MKKQLLCGVATTAISIALSGPTSAAPPIPSMYNWSGFYIGAHAGSGKTSFNGTWFGDSGATGFADNARGGLGGLQAGFNWQVNTFVYGFEADVSFLNWQTQTLTFSGAPGSGDQLSAKLKLLSSFRGRLGLAFDRALFYVTGGLGYARGSMQAFDGGGPTFISSNFAKWGGVIGGGFEFAFTNNLSARVEGLHYQFSDSKLLVGPNDSALIQIRNADVIRVGLNYRFSP